MLALIHSLTHPARPHAHDGLQLHDRSTSLLLGHQREVLSPRLEGPSQRLHESVGEYLLQDASDSAELLVLQQSVLLA